MATRTKETTWHKNYSEMALPLIISEAITTLTTTPLTKNITVDTVLCNT